MRAMLLACGLLLAASPALAQRTDLPPADRVNEALDNHPSVAAAAARVEAAMTHQEDVQTDLKTILSRYQDTDIIENFNEIVKQETALQAALSITAKVSEISILDYL